MKDKILLSAVKVFNQKGIKNSSLRDIAKEIPISDGHLRYYFKTKEELILATFSEMDQEIAAFAAQGIMEKTEVNSIISALIKSFNVLHRYAFFFTESPDMFEKYPKVYIAYEQLIEKRREMFINLFRGFQHAGTFIGEIDEMLFPVLFEQFFILSDSWVRYARMPDKRDRNEEKQVEHYVAVAVALFLPYFNPDPREQALLWIKKAF